ncbi:MAG: hypothetical protein IKD18_01105 [Clostridia bacterium]|nr:hypothetical protein [Clostridia bacterium]
MKKLGSFLLGLLPHITLILSLMLLTFFVIDQFNEAMAFLDNTITKWLLAITAFLTVILSVLAIFRQSKP